MRTTSRAFVLTVAIVSLTILVLTGCGKQKPSTDVADIGTNDTRSGSASDTDGPPPPPPRSVDDAIGGGSGSGSIPEPEPPLDLGDVHFEFDQYALGSEARGVLAQNARMIESRPQARVTIEGHCDERGTIEYNLALGEKRAQSVKEYLVRYGIENRRLATVSFGEERPMDRSQSEEAWAKNRRAHLKTQ